MAPRSIYLRVRLKEREGLRGKERYRIRKRYNQTDKEDQVKQTRK